MVSKNQITFFVLFMDNSTSCGMQSIPNIVALGLKRLITAAK